MKQSFYNCKGKDLKKSGLKGIQARIAAVLALIVFVKRKLFNVEVWQTTNVPVNNMEYASVAYNFHIIKNKAEDFLFKCQVSIVMLILETNSYFDKQDPGVS